MIPKKSLFYIADAALVIKKYLNILLNKKTIDRGKKDMAQSDPPPIPIQLRSIL